MITSSFSSASRVNRKARHWVAHLASGECSTGDLERLQRWLARRPAHREAFDRQRALWRSLGAARELVLSARPDLLEVPPPPRARAWWRRPLWQGGAALASLVLVCLLAPSALLSLQADARSNHQPQSLVLEDGSQVVLDADSAIAIDYTAEQRRVRLLRGRAWFEVVHQSRPFQVEAGTVRVVDVGTAFAVDSAAEGVVTDVAEGEVDLFADSSAAPLRLHAGQSARVLPNGAVHRLLGQLPDNAGAWRHGEVLITGMDAEAAIAQLARYRRAPVWTLGALGDEQVTAVFHADQPDQAIQTVALQLGLAVKRLPGGALLVYRQES